MPTLPRLPLLLWFIGALCAPSPAAERTAQQPNIVFILVDDMPWFGTPVRMSPNLPESAMAFRHMPNVEKLAAQGMTFRNAYAAAGMCGPSRCSIQTGMMTARHLYSGNGGFGEKTNGTVEYMSRGQDAARPLLQPEPQGNGGNAQQSQQALHPLLRPLSARCAVRSAAPAGQGRRATS